MDELERHPNLEEPVEDLLLLEALRRALAPRHRLLQRAARAVLHDDVQHVAQDEGAEILGDILMAERLEQSGLVGGLGLLVGRHVLQRDLLGHEELACRDHLHEDRAAKGAGAHVAQLLDLGRVRGGCELGSTRFQSPSRPWTRSLDDGVELHWSRCSARRDEWATSSTSKCHLGNTMFLIGRCTPKLTDFLHTPRSRVCLCPLLDAREGKPLEEQPHVANALE